MPDSRDIETIEWLAERLSYACTTKQGDCGIPEPCPQMEGVACCDVEPADWLAVWEKVKSSTYEKSVEGGE